MAKLNLIFFNFDGGMPLIRDLMSIYKDSRKFDPMVINNDAEVNQYLGSSSNGIFLFKVSDKKNLQEAINVLKSNRKDIKKGLIKPACITSIRNKKVENVLAKYGCVDLLEPDTKAKTASFKLEFWSKPITTQIEKIEKIEKEEQLALKKQNEKNNASQASETKEDFVLQKPLELPSDIWIIKSKADYKKILRRWLIKLLGPSPYIGSWVELENQSGGSPVWKYVLKDPSNKEYIVEEGTWYFTGNKPEFDWKQNRWSFPSEVPHLYFRSKNGDLFSRFKLHNGQVHIAENSQFALMREEMILETCDSKFNFERDGVADEESKNLEGDSDTDSFQDLKGHVDENLDDQGKPLSGKSSTDKLNGDPLSGKSSTDKYGEDPLSGKSSTDEYGKDPLSGKSSTDNFGEDPLSGFTKNQKSEENEQRNEFDEGDIEKYYNGKSSTDTYGENALSGKSSTDEYGKDPLSGKNSNQSQDPNDPRKNEFQEDPLKKHWGGETSTDEYGKDPLSGKNSNQSQDPNDPRKNEFQEDPLKKHWGGESSTDEYGKDPLAGKNPNQSEDPNDPRNNEFQEDPLKKHWGGESSTDEYGKDPLSGKNTNQSQDPNDPRNNEFQEDPLKKHWGGESSTDEYGKDPLAGKITKNHREGTDPRKNNFDEEALKKHYKGKVGADGTPAKPKIDKDGNPLLNPECLPKDKDGNPIIDPSLLPLDENGEPLIDPNLLPKGIDGKPYIDPEQLPVDPEENIILDPNALKGFAKRQEPRMSDTLAEYDVMDGFGENQKNIDPESEEYLEELKAEHERQKQNAREADEALAREIREKIAALKKENPNISEDDLAGEIAAFKASRQAEIDKKRRDELGKQTKEKLEREVKDREALIKKERPDISSDDLARELEEFKARKSVELDKKYQDDLDKLTKEKLAREINEQEALLKKERPDISSDDLARELEEFKKRKEADRLDDVRAAANKMADERMAKEISEMRDSLKKKHPDQSDDDFAKELAAFKRKKELDREKALKDSAEIGDYFNEKKRKNERDRALAEAERSQSAANGDRALKGKDLYGVNDSKKKHGSNNSREEDLEDALGGGLTEGAYRDEEDVFDPNQQIGRAREQVEDELDLNTVIGGAPVGINLESGELKVVLKQTTNAGNEISFICEFEDFYEDELIVRAPRNSLAQSSEVLASVSLTYNGQKVKLGCVGIIEEIEEFSKLQETLVININKIDKKLYVNFIELYEDRQNSINDFMLRAKGY